jgi:protein-histidine pros-kinase
MIFLAAAYFQVQAGLLRAGRERAQAAADQLASLFGQAAQQRLADLRVAAADGAVRRFLDAPDEQTRRAALDRLKAVATSGSQVIELWDNDGHRLLTIAVPPQTEQLLPKSDRPSAPGYGPFRAANAAVFSDFVAEVQRDGARSRAALPERAGYLVVRRLSSTAGASDVLGRLVGIGAAVAIGNQAGDVWTDLSKIVSAPVVDLHRAGSADIRAGHGVRRLGALSLVRGTPWAVWIDFPRSSITAPAFIFLTRMGVVLALVLVLSAVFTVVLTRRITTPLADLTAAAEAVANGNYSHRVTTTRNDEIGRLAGAFNTMGRHIADDIAARERVEQALQDREASLRALFEGNALPMWVYDVSTLEFLEVNEAAVRSYGYSRDEFLAKRITDIRPPEDVPRLLSDIEQERDSWQHSENWRHRLKSGQIIDVDITSHTLTFQGRASVLVVAQDITERRQADLALQESEARKSAVMEGALDCIVTMDHKGVITEFNPAAERTFGYSRHEAIGRPLAELLIPQRLRDRHRQGLARFAETGEGPVLGKRIELPAMKRDGTEFPAELSIVLVRRDGPPVFTGFVRDLTDQKAAEAVRLRTLRLEEENKRVQEANRMKSEFLANMSHELRTPLNGIIGFSEFLVDEKAGTLVAKQKEYLNDILNSGRHLLQLINDVLDLSKVEAGKMELFPESFTLPKAVEEVCSVISPLAKKKNIAVRQNMSGVVDSVTLDLQKFKQVLYNLLSNAVKFTDEGGGVDIVATQYDPNQLRVQVKDTGIGITPEDVGKLFVEFQQLDSSAARRYQGTGLGLALTKKIVELQKGSISVQSEPGKGSTFTVILPLGAEKGVTPSYESPHR